MMAEPPSAQSAYTKHTATWCWHRRPIISLTISNFGGTQYVSRRSRTCWISCRAFSEHPETFFWPRIAFTRYDRIRALAETFAEPKAVCFRVDVSEIGWRVGTPMV